MENTFVLHVDHGKLLLSRPPYEGGYSYINTYLSKPEILYTYYTRPISAIDIKITLGLKISLLNSFRYVTSVTYYNDNGVMVKQSETYEELKDAVYEYNCSVHVGHDPLKLTTPGRQSGEDDIRVVFPQIGGHVAGHEDGLSFLRDVSEASCERTCGTVSAPPIGGAITLEFTPRNASRYYYITRKDYDFDEENARALTPIYLKLESASTVSYSPRKIYIYCADAAVQDKEIRLTPRCFDEWESVDEYYTTQTGIDNLSIRWDGYFGPRLAYGGRERLRFKVEPLD